MSVEALEFQPYVQPDAHEVPSVVPSLWTGIAVYDGTRWTSLCWELDVASQGDTAREALANLQDAVEETLAYLRESRPDVDVNSLAVPDEELRQFMLSHGGSSRQSVVGKFAA